MQGYKGYFISNDFERNSKGGPFGNKDTEVRDAWDKVKKKKCHKM